MTARLREALREHAVLEGDFVLARAAGRPVYFDKYRFETRPELLGPLEERLAAAALGRARPRTLSQAPSSEPSSLAASASLASGLPFLIVRKEAKGTAREPPRGRVRAGAARLS